jgi:hypothetical protein
MKSWSWLLLIISAIAIKWLSFYPDWVEKNYTYGIYPVIAKLQRQLFGWIPFSIGDIFYLFLVMVILVKTSQFFRLLFKKQITRKYFITGLQQFIFFFLFLYIVFNLLWGLNYNRKGIAAQLKLDVREFSVTDLDTLATVLYQRLNYYAAQVDTLKRDSIKYKKYLFQKGNKAYRSIGAEYSFLNYSFTSIKPSLYSSVGHLIGFTGYYNPFSGEAQVKTTFPLFLQPYITAHEIAHQLGYGKENEANFVAFLACRSFDDNDFRYSCYFDLCHYAFTEILASGDTNLLRKFIILERHPQVKKDNRELWSYYRRTRNFIEPLMSKLYSEYLRFNNQPEGKKTYDKVITWLIAYYKKYGLDAL